MNTTTRYRLTCTCETATRWRYLAEAHTNLADAVAAMVAQQQGPWQVVTLTPVQVPTHELAADVPRGWTHIALTPSSESKSSAVTPQLTLFVP